MDGSAIVYRQLKSIESTVVRSPRTFTNRIPPVLAGTTKVMVATETYRVVAAGVISWTVLPVTTGTPGNQGLFA